ncbi:MAG: 2Fe-2S iron-sulfur cluster-binding protein [Aquabacterium sp.]|uniref:2Fe-2S iron-sulfur cluster-binding protein n=1 Tax=Aquabacterium sp. TaxID=1872578 RepID=UPI002725331C|nr:2Fe-2S iron-sulfur cluster-binding protein [Aquabacterium sp.]MDO9002928.1 2Fe-2S iron-sulfur cluster-binding protein [Aquabacterium sp.]
MGEVGETAWHELLIEPLGVRLRVSAEQPLLASARAAGIELPSSCRNGTCRTCLCRLVRGQVSYRIEWPGVSFEEKRDGFILPCVAYPMSDLVMDAPGVRRANASAP